MMSAEGVKPHLEKGFAVLLGQFPAACALFLTLFYSYLFYSWNVPEELVNGQVSASAEERLNSGVDVCRVSPSKLQVDAWAVIDGTEFDSSHLLLFLQDSDTGSYYRLKSRARLLTDIGGRSSWQFGDDIGAARYGVSGSINYAVGMPGLTRGTVFLGRFVGDGYRLQEIPCGV